jgi:hypothetical protein
LLLTTDAVIPREAEPRRNREDGNDPGDIPDGHFKIPKMAIRSAIACWRPAGTFAISVRVLRLQSLV